jgi:hypothetical protein
MLQEDSLVNTLENFDLTRKVFAVNTMDALSRLINLEAAKPNPDLNAIASLATALAAILLAVT